MVASLLLSAQGAGIGSLLLGMAERHASQTMGVSTAVMWVIDTRADLLAYYGRRGYVLTDQTAPFPPAEANVGTPKSDGITFVSLRKPLPTAEEELPGGWKESGAD